MKKVKHILATFLHSFIPQDIYYPKLLHTRFRFSLTYYLVILSVCAFVLTGIVLYQVSPSRIIGYKNATVQSLSTFPENVHLTMTNGVLESDLNKPLFLWVYDGKQPLFMFMIHTKDVVKKAHIPQPLIYLGQDTLQVSYRGTTYVRPYSPLLNLSVTRANVHSFIAKINTYFPTFLLFFYILLVIIVPLAFMVGVTLLILLSALLAFMLLRTFIPHIHIKKSIQAGMHGTHLPLFLIVFLYSLFPSAVNVFTIAVSLIFIFTLVSTYEMYSKSGIHLKGR